MAFYIFCKQISEGKPIPVFNHGDMKRDFTYVDDIINGIRSSIEKNLKCEIFNLGNNKCEDLLNVINLIEQKLNKKAKMNFLEMQPGDVKTTVADIEYSKKILGYNPKTSISEGIPRFIDWFKSQNKIYT